MTWQILIMTAILSGSIMNLLQRVIMRDQRSNPALYASAYQIIAGILVGIFLIIRGFQQPSLVGIWPNLIITTTLFGVSNIFLYKALQHIEASKFIIIYASRAIWSIIGSLIFLGESFLPKYFLGTILILFSIVITNKSIKKFNLGIGEKFVIITAALQGMAFVNDAYVIQKIDPIFYAMLAFILPGIFSMILSPNSIREANKFLNFKLFLRLLMLSLLFAITTVAIYEAYQIGRNASQIAPLLQITTLVTVILATIFLKETNNLFSKTIGVILSILGVILLK